MIPSFDVIIVGGGPGALSAALVLGRARRRVLVIDDGSAQRDAARVLHGVLMRDGISLAKLLRIGRSQLDPYETVTSLPDKAVTAMRGRDGFHLETRSRRVLASRKLILAEAMEDVLPDIPGLQEMYARSVFHCPHNDAWDVREHPLAVHGASETAAALAVELLGWTKDIVLCVEGDSDVSEFWRDRMSRHCIALIKERIERLEGQDGQLERIVFHGGKTLARRAMVLATPRRPSSDLAAQLGCDAKHSGRTNVPGLYVIAEQTSEVVRAAVAAGDGCATALAASRDLLEEDFP